MDESQGEHLDKRSGPGVDEEKRRTALVRLEEAIEAEEPERAVLALVDLIELAPDNAGIVRILEQAVIKLSRRYARAEPNEPLPPGVDFLTADIDRISLLQAYDDSTQEKVEWPAEEGTDKLADALSVVLELARLKSATKALIIEKLGQIRGYYLGQSGSVEDIIEDAKQS